MPQTKPSTKPNLKKTFLTTENASKTASAGSSAQGMVPIRKFGDMARPKTGVDPKAHDRWQRENMLRELDAIDAELKARLKKNQEEYDKLNIPRNAQEAAKRNWEETAASRKQFYEADKALAEEIAKQTGEKPKYSRAPSMATVQARAARNSVVEPVVNAATTAATSASGGMLASPLAKGVGAIGVVAAAQKGAGLPPKQENAAVDEWNKRTNYGRIQGPTSKALGVVNVKPGSK